MNNPMKFIDPNGEDVYMYFYTMGNENSDSDKAFYQAAMTRALDKLKKGEIGEGDIYVLKGISDLGKLGDEVSNVVSQYSEQYGQTKEFGIWSHGALDGPTGSQAASKDALSEGSSQLSITGWGNIDFNWVDNGGIAGFYGCRTGSDESGSAFNQKNSIGENMKDVSVWGQTARSWPSPYTNIRQTTSDIRDGNHQYPTYFVGSSKDITHRAYSVLGINSAAYPMSIYKNGQFIMNQYQSGRRYK
jgi:hypothetical protein